MIRVYLIALAAGLVAATAVYQAQKSKWRSEGAQQQMSRVEKAERKIDAKIEKRQRAIAKQPPSSVLDRWSTD